MYNVTEQQHDQNHAHKQDRNRRQYDTPSMRSPRALSPEITEVLHMLKAFEVEKIEH